MAIYIHKFPDEEQFDEARNNSYNEPWVSLTVSGETTTPVDWFIINVEGTDYKLYYVMPMNGRYMWSTLRQEWTITEVNLDDEYESNHTIVANGYTFEFDTSYENISTWSADVYDGCVESLTPAVGDKLIVFADGNNEILQTENRTVNVGDVIDLGEGTTVEVNEVGQDGGEVEIINRIDYNKPKHVIKVKAQYRTRRDGEYVYIDVPQYSYDLKSTMFELPGDDVDDMCDWFEANIKPGEQYYYVIVSVKESDLVDYDTNVEVERTDDYVLFDDYSTNTAYGTNKHGYVNLEVAPTTEEILLFLDGTTLM